MRKFKRLALIWRGYILGYVQRSKNIDRPLARLPRHYAVPPPAPSDCFRQSHPVSKSRLNNYKTNIFPGLLFRHVSSRLLATHFFREQIPFPTLGEQSLFPSKRSMSKNTINSALRCLGYTRFWADYLGNLAAGGKVIAFKKSAA